MIYEFCRKRVSIGFAVAAALLVHMFALFAAAQSAGAPASQAVSLDYGFFKERVQPIFLKRRSPDHARCYSCHEQSRMESRLRLETLAPGASSWNEEQSRRNFQTLSRLVVPGEPLKSRFLIHPLAPQAGGHLSHGGGWQFESQNDPDWQNMAAWVRGQKAGGSSRP